MDIKTSLHEGEHEPADKADCRVGPVTTTVSKRFLKALQQAADVLDGGIKLAYSGRYMYGHECVAFYSDYRVVAMIAMVAKAAADQRVLDEAVRWIADIDIDDFGKIGSIIYAPSWVAPKTAVEVA